MRLTAQLMAYLVGALVVVLAVDGYLSVRRQVALFDEDQQDYALRLGGTMGRMIEDVWRTRGSERAFQLIRDADNEDHRVRIRWVWLDAVGDDPMRPLATGADLGAVARGLDHSFKGADADGNECRFTYIPVPTGESRKGALELSESLERLHDYSTATLRRVLTLSGVLVLGSGVITLLLGVRLFGRPLQQLAEKTRRVGKGDLAGPLRLKGRNELTELANAMNLMCERLTEAQTAVNVETQARIAALEQLRHADRLTTVGRLASGVAHELGTPLNVVSGRASFIASGEFTAEETRKSAEIIRAQSERMTAIIRKLLDFARRSSPQRARVDVGQIARRSVELVESLVRRVGVEVALEETGTPIRAWVDPEQVQQVLANLLVNAFQAMPDGGRVDIRIRSVQARAPDSTDEDAEFLLLEVEDNGEGMTEEVRSRLFDPFFTTKDVGTGTGLGLSIAHGIVRDHGGWIEVASEVGRGSRFSVYLPKEVDACPATY